MGYANKEGRGRKGMIMGIRGREVSSYASGVFLEALVASINAENCRVPSGVPSICWSLIVPLLSSSKCRCSA